MQPPASFRFFDADDAVFIETAVERLIPADVHGPGARHTGVAVFIDRQLAGAWKNDDRLFRSGAWHAGQLRNGYRLPRSPGELFRSALKGIEADLAERPQFSVVLPVALNLTAVASGDRTRRRGDDPDVRAMSARRMFATLQPSQQDEYLKLLKDGQRILEDVPSELFFECLFGLTIEGFFNDPMVSGNEESVAAHAKLDGIFLQLA